MQDPGCDFFFFCFKGTFERIFKPGEGKRKAFPGPFNTYKNAKLLY